MGLDAGFGKVEVTPPSGGGPLDLRILGYWFERDKAYGEIHDPLYARAAAFGSGADVVCIVSVDMIADGEGFGALARSRIEKRLGLAPERVMIVCTHSHTTPTTAFSDRAASGEWLNQLADGISSAVETAVSAMEPCALSLVESKLSGISVNRRAQWCGKGEEVLSAAARERHCFLDDTLRLAVAYGKNNVAIGALLNYALHPVTVQTQPIISADFPGVATAMLEKQVGVSLYTNSGCGDVNPVRKGDFEAVAWTGGRIGECAAGMMAGGRELRRIGNGRIRGVRREVLLPRREMPDVKVLEREAARLEREAEAAGPVTTEQKRSYDHPGWNLFNVREQLAVARMPAEITTEVQVLEVGEWLMVGVPGEMVGCLAADIRASVVAHEGWVIGYANGYIGYVVTCDAFDVGGYEVRPGRWSLLAPGAGELLRDAAIALVREFEA